MAPIFMENLEIGTAFTGSGEDGVKLAVSSSLNEQPQVFLRGQVGSI